MTHLGFLTRASLLLALLSTMVAAGDWTAQAYQAGAVASARLAIERSDSAFQAQLRQSLGEGTPDTLLGPVRAAELAARTGTGAPAPSFVDRTWVSSLQLRATRIDGYRREVVAVEVQAEVELDHQLRAALQTVQ